MQEAGKQSPSRGVDAADCRALEEGSGAGGGVGGLSAGVGAAARGGGSAAAAARDRSQTASFSVRQNAQPCASGTTSSRSAASCASRPATLREGVEAA